MSLTFADLGVSAAVRGALAERGFHEPFAIQKLVIADVLAGHDVLGQSPTGSGKTLAFGVPIADRLEATDPRPSALVLAPTRELAAQIVEETREVAHARALSIAAVYGGVGYEKQIRVARKAHILVATPGRLEDLLQRRALSLQHIKVLVLDEADRMLDMGFKPAVDRIVAQCPRDRQTLFFSATLTGEAGRAAARYTHDARRHEHRHPQDATTAIEHRFLAVEHERKLDALVAELDGRTLVFVRTKRGADRLTKRLSAHGIEAVAMHGNKSQAQREKALARFEAGGVDTLVATDVAARGIDVDGISHVINFDPPDDHDAYTHRVGRTGRAGRTGVGITFVGADEAHDVSRMAAALDLHREFAGSGLRPAPSSASRGGSRPPARNGKPARSSSARGQARRRQRVR